MDGKPNNRFILIFVLVVVATHFQTVGGLLHAEEKTPLWPIDQYQKAEELYYAGDYEKALPEYEKMVRWAAQDPYGDGRGGCALAAFGLLRWAEGLERQAPPKKHQALQFLECFEKLIDTNLIRGMVKTSPVLPGLPQLKENLLRRSSRIAFQVGWKEKALHWYHEYLTIATSKDFTPLEQEIIQAISSSKLLAHHDLLFLRAKKMTALGDENEAKAALGELMLSSDKSVRAKALLAFAKLEYKTKRGTKRREVVEILDRILRETPPKSIIQQVLFYRFRVLYREGAHRDVFQALNDLHTLLELYPDCSFADDALYRLARHYQLEGDMKQALHYYKKLQQFSGPNNWKSLSRFQPAMIHYAFGDRENLGQAETLLQDLLNTIHDSPLRLNAMFWLGRIYEDREQYKDAHKWFEAIIRERPYDYYALRARMHKTIGKKASAMLWVDSQTEKEINAAYKESKAETDIKGDSPYHLRLKHAVDGHLYDMALSCENRFRTEYPSIRLEEIPLKELNGSGLMTCIGLLLSLRQDVLVAKRIDKRPENFLNLACAIGIGSNDWPVALAGVLGMPEIHKDPNYLASVYPVVYREIIKSVADNYSIPPELLYAVIYSESRFYPAALSPQKALGLFQFTGGTFKSIFRKYKELDLGDATSMEEYLLDPERSIDLGGFWFSRELITNQNGNLIFAIMEHNAGYPAVKSWREHWEAMVRRDDIEYTVETARFLSTRKFVRNVWKTMALVKAAGVFPPISHN